MSISMWVRTLTSEERTYISESNVGKKTASFYSVSVMGCDDNYHIKFLNIKRKIPRDYIGNGEYLNNLIGDYVAQGGLKAPIIWSRDSYQGYLLGGCNALNIPIVRHDLDFNILYFESRYADAFLQVFSYVERTLSSWYNNRPLVVRWFGDNSPDFDSREGKAIQENVCALLRKAKNLPAY